MAFVALRSKKTGKVTYLSDTYLTIFPDTWERADVAVAAGLVEHEAEKVVQDSPVKGKSLKKKEAPDA